MTPALRRSWLNRFSVEESEPGFDVANSATICAGHGAFGAHGDIVHDFGVNYAGSNNAPGASGYQTGLNNSGPCGNRQ